MHQLLRQVPGVGLVELALVLLLLPVPVLVTVESVLVLGSSPGHTPVKPLEGL